jgi:hypothetical protein
MATTRESKSIPTISEQQAGRDLGRKSLDLRRIRLLSRFESCRLVSSRDAESRHSDGTELRRRMRSRRSGRREFSFASASGTRSFCSAPPGYPLTRLGSLLSRLPRAPVKTGELKGMKESNSEGVATHAGPTPCVVVRKGGGEASAGVRAGRALSREIRDPQRELRKLRGADALGEGGRQHHAHRHRKVHVALARSPRPRARTESTRTGTGRSRRWLRGMGLAVRIVKPKGERR